MKKKINKKAQFYLLAAIIIIGIILGFATITNYVKKKSNVKIYDLAEELDIESANVIEFGTYSEYNDEDMKNLLDHFTGIYTLYGGEDKEIFFIIGNKNEIKIISYEEITVGEIDVVVGGGPVPSLTLKGKTKKEESISPQEDEIKIMINDEWYGPFILTEGENFYFVISQEIEGEQYVVS